MLLYRNFIYCQLSGTPDRIRTCIGRLSDATGYKSAVLPLNYRSWDFFKKYLSHMLSDVLATRTGFEPVVSGVTGQRIRPTMLTCQIGYTRSKNNCL